MIKISVLIPTFNRANMLKRAIKSVLDQNYENLEVVVSDNNSEDSTYEVVQNFSHDERLKYYKNDTNIGMVNNFKKGVYELISGDYFLILNDDDYLIKDDYISDVANLIKKNGDLAIVYSYGYKIIEKYNKKVEMKPPFKEIEDGINIFRNYLKYKNITSGLCNIVFNRKMALTTNSFSNENNLLLDMELFLKMCLFGKVGLIKDFASVYNYHPQNESSNSLNNYKFTINSVDHVINPFNCALKFNKLSDEDIKYWEDIIFRMFINCLANVRFYFPEKYDDTIEFLRRKNEKILNIVLKSNYNKFLNIMNRIHLFRIVYKIRYFIWQISSSK